MTASDISLVTRLSRSLTAWMGGIWIICSIFFAGYMHHEVNKGFDAILIGSAYPLLDLVASEYAATGHVPHQTMSQIRIFPEHSVNVDEKKNDYYLAYQVTDSSGNLILRSLDAPKLPEAAARTLGFSEDDHWRIYTLKHPQLPLVFSVADPLQHRTELLRDSLLTLLAVLLALLPLLAFVVRRVAQIQLRSVCVIAGEIAARSGGNLKPLEIQGQPRELASIIENTNHLMYRLQKALTTERAMAANTAHELRTPLAALQLLLFDAQQHDMPNPAREALHRAIAGVERLNHRTDKLLQFSRAEASAVLTQTLIDLGKLAGAVVQEFWQTASAESDVRHRLRLILPEGATVRAFGDFDSLAIALRNLIENALKYAPQSEVQVSVEHPATLTVRDFGPGVSIEALHRLMRRHVRFNSDNVGYGLGLSIVQGITEKHGGIVRLQSSAPDLPPGFRATIMLPPVQAQSFDEESSST